MPNQQLFREQVQAFRKPTGYSQEDLAAALGIQRQVLARKFLGEKARFTHSEIKQIVKTLAEWDAFTTRAEAETLLALMDLRPEIFAPTEWHSPPLAKLEASLPPRQIPPPVILRRPPKTPNLPLPLTQFIGRETVLQKASELLLTAPGRLLTLLGPGGVGKTRLSLELGRRLRDSFAEGVFFADLASLTDPAQLVGTLAQTFGIGLPNLNEVELRREITDFLSSRAVLLILDNFEQILPAASLVADLLANAPALKILVTSRATLQIYGEYEFSLPPLSLPDLDSLPAENDFASLAQSEAVKLFVARAQASLPTFSLTATNFSEIARLCVLLEGLPLSLELAAAHVKTLPLPYLLTCLQESKLATLSQTRRNLAPRQQSLRAAIEWSYNLLDATLRELFNRLAIFRGSFSPAAVAQICFPEIQLPSGLLLSRLTELSDQSLLKPLSEAANEPRFAMLETLREYALEKLEEAGELEKLQSRYCDYYVNLCEKLTTDFYLDPDDRQGVTLLLEQDFDNFQAAQHLAENSALPTVPPAESNTLTTKNAPIIVSHTFFVARPPEQVFAFIADPENWPKWNNLIKECAATDDSPLQAGKTYELTVSLLGRRYRQVATLTAFALNDFIEFQTAPTPLHVIQHLQFRRENGGTRFTFTMTNNIGQVFRFTRPVLTRIIRKGSEIQLGRLKAILEAGEINSEEKQNG